MMRLSPALFAAALSILPLAVCAEDMNAADSSGGEKIEGKVKTGKERLGKKWSDDRRLDDCKVPAQKRGNSHRNTDCDSGGGKPH